MRFKLIRNIGFILLAVFLILEGISMLAGIGIPGIITGIIAIIAGVFILIGK